MAQGELVSLPHVVSPRDDAALVVDLQFEGAIRGRQLPCVQDEGDEHQRLANAVKLATVMGVDQVVVARLERQATGPAWFAASLVHAPTAQKVREGGLKVSQPGSPPDGLEELADFIVTGQPSRKVVTTLPAAEQVSPPLTAEPAATITSTAPVGPQKSSKTTAGFSFLAAGALLAGGGIAFQVESGRQWQAFNAYYAGGGAPDPSQIPSAHTAQTHAQLDAILGWTGVGVGAAALGAGAYFLWADRPAGAGGWVLLPGPGGLTCTGAFP